MRKTGLGKGVVPGGNRGISRRWDEMIKTEVGLQMFRKNDLEILLRLVSNDSSSATNRTLGWDMPRVTLKLYGEIIWIARFLD